MSVVCRAAYSQKTHQRASWASRQQLQRARQSGHGASRRVRPAL